MKEKAGVVCGCGFELEERYSFCPGCARALRPAANLSELPGSVTGQSLCHTFRACSTRTFELLGQRHYDNGRLVPHEDDCTRRNLLDLERLHSDRISSRRFISHEEVLNGADWQWWLYSGAGGIGLRVQAKRSSARGRFKFNAPAGSTSELQCDVLIADAAAVGMIPVYVLYNHLNWVSPHELGGIGRCAHGSGQQAHLGCTIVSAKTVQAQLRQGKSGSTYVRDQSIPWHRLFCDGPQNSLQGLDAAAARVRSMDADGQNEIVLAEEAIRRAKGGKPTSGRPGPSPQPTGTGRVDELRSRPAEFSSRRWLSIPEDVQLGRDRAASADELLAEDAYARPAADEFFGVPASPLSPLPDYVQDVIAGRSIDRPDERTGLIVALNLGDDQPEFS